MSLKQADNLRNIPLFSCLDDQALDALSIDLASGFLLGGHGIITHFDDPELQHCFVDLLEPRIVLQGFESDVMNSLLVVNLLTYGQISIEDRKICQGWGQARSSLKVSEDYVDEVSTLLGAVKK